MIPLTWQIVSTYILQHIYIIKTQEHLHLLIKLKLKNNKAFIWNSENKSFKPIKKFKTNELDLLVSLKKQKELSRAIKRARFLGLMSYTQKIFQ